MNQLEEFWEQILSRQPGLIIKAFTPLDVPTRASVIAHLQRMVTEPDWHAEQLGSAQTALAVIETLSK